MVDLSQQWCGWNYVGAYRLQSAALPPFSLTFCVGCWLSSEDLVNALASWRLADTPACHGCPPYSGQTNQAVYRPSEETANFVLITLSLDLHLGLKCFPLLQTLLNTQQAEWLQVHLSDR